MKKLSILLFTAVACGSPPAEGPSDAGPGKASAASAGSISGSVASRSAASGISSTANSTGPGTSGATISNEGSTRGATAGSSSTGTSTGGLIAGGGSTGAGSTGGTTAGCSQDGQFVGVGDVSMCCSGHITSQGYCGTDESSTTGTGTVGANSTNGTTGLVTGGIGNSSSISTSGGSTGGVGSTGTTGAVIGSPCPNNMPNIHNGQTAKGGGACGTSVDLPVCPTGFSCVDGQCILNGGDSPLQITLSWDDPEDLDLHVLEPGHPGAGYGPGKDYCEIYYGNPGPVPQDAGFPNIPGLDAGIFGNLFGDGGILSHLGGKVCSVGWLDRDSNAACKLDNVDIENVLYPQSPPYSPAPAGEYIVRVDYWEQCDGHQKSAYAVQIRNNGVYTTYCGQLDASQADEGNAGSGVTVTTFTVP